MDAARTGQAMTPPPGFRRVSAGGTMVRTWVSIPMESAAIIYGLSAELNQTPAEWMRAVVMERLASQSRRSAALEAAAPILNPTSLRLTARDEATILDFQALAKLMLLSMGVTP